MTASSRSTIKVRRGPGGYDVVLDEERVGHAGTLIEAESFAEGLACGIIATGGDVDIDRSALVLARMVTS